MALGVRHLKAAETALGRTFSLPMNSEERAFFTCFLIKKGLKKATIANYLTAIRHYELASGAQHPAENSELTRSGVYNISINCHMIISPPLVWEVLKYYIPTF